MCCALSTKSSWSSASDSIKYVTGTTFHNRGEVLKAIIKYSLKEQLSPSSCIYALALGTFQSTTPSALQGSMRSRIFQCLSF